MAGSLTLTIGPLTASRTLTAETPELNTAIRDAVRTWGYPGDAAIDDAQVVADWFVGALVRYARDASRGHRARKAARDAHAVEVDVMDPFDKQATT